MKLKIHVTERDILQGKCSDPRKCPIARATTRALVQASGNRDVYAQVRSHAMSIREFDPFHFWPVNVVDLIEHPSRAVKFIHDYDRERAGKPFTFTLTV